jgi:hypothetical protein
MCRCTSWARMSTLRRRSSAEPQWARGFTAEAAVSPVPGVIEDYCFILSAMVTIQPSGASKANSRMP